MHNYVIQQSLLLIQNHGCIFCSLSFTIFVLYGQDGFALKINKTVKCTCLKIFIKGQNKKKSLMQKLSYKKRGEEDEPNLAC